MTYLKRCWINEILMNETTDDLFSITLESEYPNDYRVLSATERKFPANPDKLHPLHHTMDLYPLSYNDLVELHNKIGELLKESNNVE